MENRVGDKLLSEQKKAEIEKTIADLGKQLRSVGIVLSADERKRVLRQRRGADAHVQLVHDLAQKHKLDLKKIPLDGMTADLTLSKQFEGIESQLRTVLTIAEDTGAQADSEAWEAFLAYYGVLSKMAERDPDIESEIASVVEFMSNGPRKRKTEEK